MKRLFSLIALFVILCAVLPLTYITARGGFHGTGRGGGFHGGHHSGHHHGGGYNYNWLAVPATIGIVTGAAPASSSNDPDNIIPEQNFDDFEDDFENEAELVQE